MAIKKRIQVSLSLIGMIAGILMMLIGLIIFVIEIKPIFFDILNMNWMNLSTPTVLFALGWLLLKISTANKFLVY